MSVAAVISSVAKVRWAWRKHLLWYYFSRAEASPASCNSAKQVCTLSFLVLSFICRRFSPIVWEKTRWRGSVLSLGQKLQVENKYSLTLGVVLVLLGRPESKKVEGWPGPLHTGSQTYHDCSLDVRSCSYFQGLPTFTEVMHQSPFRFIEASQVSSKLFDVTLT